MAGRHLGWGLYALAFAAYSAQVVQTSFPTAVLHQLQGNAILALLSIPIWLLTVRRMDRTGGNNGDIGPIFRALPLSGLPCGINVRGNTFVGAVGDGDYPATAPHKIYLDKR